MKKRDHAIERQIPGAGPGAGDDACRCKETANMSPRELLQRMMDDLAYWKKGKRTAPDPAPHADRGKEQDR